MILDILMTAGGLLALFIGGEMFVKGASQLARSFGISSLVVGLTVVAIGTSMPELIVSVGASLTASSDIAIGNVVGSNIANIGLILGITALIAPFMVHVRMLKQEIPIMIGVTLLAYFLLMDGTLSRIDGIILLMTITAYFAWILFSVRREMAQETQEAPPIIARQWEVVRMVSGLILLLIGARLTVDGAVSLARAIGLSELVIGMTLVAVGTSLPELVTSLVAARRGESDIALGNVVGSNIANLLLILGVTSVIQPIPIAEQVIRLDALVMIGFSLLLIPFALNRRIDRRKGFFFLFAYCAYVIFLLLPQV